jgi:hypothetical protein
MVIWRMRAKKGKGVASTYKCRRMKKGSETRWKETEMDTVGVRRGNLPFSEAKGK